MCGRVVAKFIKEALDTRGLPIRYINESFRNSFNVAPSKGLLTIRLGEEGMDAQSFRLGLIPDWTKNPANVRSTFNAHAETVSRQLTDFFDAA